MSHPRPQPRSIYFTKTPAAWLVSAWKPQGFQEVFFGAFKTWEAAKKIHIIWKIQVYIIYPSASKQGIFIGRLCFSFSDGIMMYYGSWVGWQEGIRLPSLVWQLYLEPDVHLFINSCLNWMMNQIITFKNGWKSVFPSTYNWLLIGYQVNWTLTP